MRIAHVSAVFPPYESGTGHVCYQNALQLARRGHQVTVITPANSLPPGISKDEITIQRLPTPFRIGNAAFTPGLLKLGDVDVIHLHHPFIFGAEFIRTVSQIKKIPYVLTHHNDLIGDGARRHLFSLYSQVSNRLVVANAAKYAVVSLDHAAGCQITPIFRKRWEDVVEVPNGVDPEHFQPNDQGAAVRSSFGIPEHAGLILFVGTLDRAHHFKGVEYLIQVFARIESVDTYLMITGDGDLKEHLTSVAAACGVDRRVIFTGNIQNKLLPPYYSAADLVVLPSFPPESFGIVLIEAMACGRPVIAHDIPGVRSVVSVGEDGFLARPGDMDDLLEKILTLLNNPGLRLAMGECGRAKVKSRYAWERVGERLEDLYQQVLDTPRG